MTIAFSLVECSIQLLRLWSINLALGWHLRFIGTIVISLYGLTSIIVARSVLITVQKSHETLRGIQTISDTKHRMVHLLCSVILAPIHIIAESVRSIDSNLIPFKAWNNRILCAANQVVCISAISTHPSSPTQALYSNNFLMLVRIEEGRFQVSLSPFLSSSPLSPSYALTASSSR
jgi:hypothetical protein